jgi:ABC-2 type transport system ATP-binding protein
MKAALASSLAYRPRLIVLDEPFTGLDPLVRDELIEGVLDSVEGATILISSHDLAEIETFASHIGFLDAGRLQFSEELDSLTARFREIEITFAEAPPPARAWPDTWLNLERSPAIVRFIDSNYQQQRTTEVISQIFGNPQRVTVNPMPLRSIFVSLAKTSRKAAA